MEQETDLAENSGGVGLAGVLIGALLVLAVGVGALFLTGNLGQKQTPSVQINLPKVTPTK
jgi:hypothetical protein